MPPVTYILCLIKHHKKQNKKEHHSLHENVDHVDSVKNTQIKLEDMVQHLSWLSVHNYIWQL